MENKYNKDIRPVLVTTAHKGVFFAYAEDTSGQTIKLRSARNCIYWPSTNQGFMVLAEHGPKEGAKIGPRADIELRDITSVSEVTSEAVKRWENFKWSM